MFPEYDSHRVINSAMLLGYSIMNGGLAGLCVGCTMQYACMCIWRRDGVYMTVCVFGERVECMYLCVCLEKGDVV